MNTKQAMQTARAHIQRKEYDKARTILKTVNHPTAAEWLTKLDKIQFAKRKQKTRSRFRQAALIIIAVFSVMVICGLIASNQSRSVIIIPTEARLDNPQSDTDFDTLLTTVNLIDFCENQTGQPQASCENWAQNAVDNHYEETQNCLRQHDIANEALGFFIETCFENNNMALPHAPTTPTFVSTPTRIIAPTSSGPTCPSLSATCSQLTCSQAYACLRAGNRSLDRDRDGVPCESVCG